MQKQKIYSKRINHIFLFFCFLFMLFLHDTATGEVIVIQGEKGSGYYITNGGYFSFNKIHCDARDDDTVFTIVNTGDTAIEFAGEKITMVNTDDTPALDFALNTDELKDVILPGDDTRFRIRFISDATDSKPKTAIVTLSFAGEEQAFEFLITCMAKSTVTYEFAGTGRHYWQVPGAGTATIILVGAGGGGGGGGGCYKPNPDCNGDNCPGAEGQGGKGGRAGTVQTGQFSLQEYSVLTVEIGDGGSGGISGKGCNERNGGTGSPGYPSIVYLHNNAIFTAPGGAGGSGGSGPGDRHGTAGENGYNNAPGGNHGSTSGQSGGPGGTGSTTAGGGGGAAGRPSEGHYCYPDGGYGGKGGPGYCIIVWTGFLD